MTDEIAEQASAALGMAAANEMLRKELAAANAIIHTMQDGSLARDQMGIIERAEAECTRLREALAYYACPEDCRRERLQDGTCIMAVSGECGETARAALNG